MRCGCCLSLSAFVVVWRLASASGRTALLLLLFPCACCSVRSQRKSGARSLSKGVGLQVKCHEEDETFDDNYETCILFLFRAILVKDGKTSRCSTFTGEGQLGVTDSQQ